MHSQTLIILSFAILQMILCQQCYEEGSCNQRYAYAAQKLESLNDCIERCNSRRLCKWSTWNPTNKICQFYEYCPKVDPEDCPKCSSSEKSCPKVGNSKLLVTTGLPFQNSKKSEVIDLLNSNIKCDLLADFPVESYQATGGLLYNQYPFICGGILPNGQNLISCYVYDNGNFKTNVTMPKGFQLSAGIVLNDDTLWITGGEGQPYSSVLANFKEVSNGKYD